MPSGCPTNSHAITAELRLRGEKKPDKIMGLKCRAMCSHIAALLNYQL